MILVVFMLFTLVSEGFLISKDLELPRFGQYKQWSSTRLCKDHINRGPNQQPSEWTNRTISIPVGASGVQLTAYPPNGKINDNAVGYWASIPYTDIKFNQLNISIKWWNNPWVLYIGWDI